MDSGGAGADMGGAIRDKFQTPNTKYL